MTDWKQVCRIILIAGVWIFWGPEWMGISVGMAAENLADEDAKQLVVMIDGKLGGTERFGSGIIVGTDVDSIYIVTANHVVRESGNEMDDIFVRFRWAPDRVIKANLLPQFDAALDLAVLRVADLKSTAIRLDAMPFEQVADDNSLQRGDTLYLLGYPLRKSWRLNSTPEIYVEKSGNSLEFESNFLARGLSGGALIDQQRRLVGMLRSEDPPYGDALSVATIIDKLQKWGYPTALGRQPIPSAYSFVSVGRSRICGISMNGSAYCWGSIGTYEEAVKKYELLPEYERARRHEEAEQSLQKGRLPPRYLSGDHIYKEVRAERGSQSFSRSPTRVRGGLIFKTISVGGRHTCGITVDEVTYCWGANGDGQLGNSTTESTDVPVAVSGEMKFRSVSASQGGSGGGYTCALTVNDEAYCWGANNYAQLDQPRSMERSTAPILVQTEMRLKSLSSGWANVLALTADGHLMCWGTFCPRVSFISKKSLWCQEARSRSCPSSDYEKLRFKSISLGCGLALDGRLFCWNWLAPGGKASADPVPILTDREFRLISAAEVRACAIATSGLTYCWMKQSDRSGDNQKNAEILHTSVPGGGTFQSVSVGEAGACGVTPTGTIYCWDYRINVHDTQSLHYGTVPMPVGR